jgi:hypothetical protein
VLFADVISYRALVEKLGAPMCTPLLFSGALRRDCVLRHVFDDRPDLFTNMGVIYPWPESESIEINAVLQRDPLNPLLGGKPSAKGITIFNQCTVPPSKEKLEEVTHWIKCTKVTVTVELKFTYERYAHFEILKLLELDLPHVTCLRFNWFDDDVVDEGLLSAWAEVIPNLNYLRELELVIEGHATVSEESWLSLARAFAANRSLGSVSLRFCISEEMCTQFIELMESNYVLGNVEMVDCHENEFDAIEIDVIECFSSAKFHAKRILSK